MKIYEGVLKTLSAYAIILDSSESYYMLIEFIFSKAKFTLLNLKIKRPLPSGNYQKIF